MDVFLVTVILQPTKKEREDIGVGAIVVVPVTAVIAKDKASAALKAARLVPAEHAEKEDRLEVRVMPFPSGVS